MNLENSRYAVIGLGYVGLPLAVELGKKYQTLGFDINSKRIEELNSSVDLTLEVNKSELDSSTNLEFSSNANKLKSCNVFIVTVPTPIDAEKRPDLSPLIEASRMLGKYIKKGALIIYESTVYPGATEEVCVPNLEDVSGLKLNKDFFVGYSPERINPGDKSHKLIDILKVTSGSNESTAEIVDELYATIINAGTYKASSIKVAEAAKVIENTQRDINISLVNEFALIFDRLNIDTEEVLKAAETKWNFLSFRPGLVGGHCIGVDPYYLTHKAQELNYQPEIILAGRQLNDSMSTYVANKLIESFRDRDIYVGSSKVLVMGVTFKENCPDTRNTKVFDLVESLQSHGVQVDCYDPWIQPKTNQLQSNISMIDEPKLNYYDGIIVTVAHDEFKEIGIDTIRGWGSNKHILFDLKYIFKAENVDLRL